MRATVLTNRKIETLKINYDPTPEDLTAPTLRSLYILQSRQVYEDWKINFMFHMEKINGFNNKDITNYYRYIQSYLLNLDLLLERISDEQLFDLSVALKMDFINMSTNLNKKIDKYLEDIAYKLQNEKTSKKEISNDEINKILYSSNLIKYISQF